MNVNLLSETIAQILMNNKKAQSPFVPKCPGGRTYVSIDTEGKIYPCHFFVGIERFKIGNISINGLKGKDMIIDNGIVDLSQNKFGNCTACMLSNICEGPCPYKQLALNKNHETVPQAHCSIYRTRLKESLRILSIFYKNEKWPYYNDWLRIINEGGKDKICL
jgi:radical SAM protein with 4Fe4S-binding SPASM domain